MSPAPHDTIRPINPKYIAKNQGDILQCTETKATIIQGIMISDAEMRGLFIVLSVAY